MAQASCVYQTPESPNNTRKKPAVLGLILAGVLAGHRPPLQVLLDSSHHLTSRAKRPFVSSSLIKRPRPRRVTPVPTEEFLLPIGGSLPPQAPDTPAFPDRVPPQHPAIWTSPSWVAWDTPKARTRLPCPTPRSRLSITDVRNACFFPERLTVSTGHSRTSKYLFQGGNLKPSS